MAQLGVERAARVLDNPAVACGSILAFAWIWNKNPAFQQVSHPAMKIVFLAQLGVERAARVLGNPAAACGSILAFAWIWNKNPAFQQVFIFLLKIARGLGGSACGSPCNFPGIILREPTPRKTGPLRGFDIGYALWESKESPDERRQRLMDGQQRITLTGRPEPVRLLLHSGRFRVAPSKGA